MQYHFRLQHRQKCVLNLSNNSTRSFFTETLFISSKLFFKSSSELFSKILISLIMLLLLSYSLESQALSATTSKTIHGSAPYLTFDGGVTKIITTNDLLSIKLSDGRTFTPQNNPSSSTSPIELSEMKQSFNDIDMLVPSTTDSISISDLVTQGKWADDDGDGKEGSITASGNITLSITDKNNQTVNRSDILTMCNAPYKVELSSTGGYLKTSYGVPDINTFTEGRTTYYINPKSSVAICFVRPNLREGEDIFAGSANIWNPDKGFLTQSATPSQYGRNFPTTGANGLYFDLNISGIDEDQLTWAPVTHGEITATVIRKERDILEWNSSGEKVTRVTLTGPKASDAQKQTGSPDLIPKPNLPQLFELEGKDSHGNVIVRYGFVLQKWFVHREDKLDTFSNQVSWCNSIGYRVPQVKDLTNAVCSGLLGNESMCGGAIGGTPSSKNNTYQRQIGAGFFTEWGSLFYYYRPKIYISAYKTITLDTHKSGFPFVVGNGTNGDGLVSVVDGYLDTNQFFAACTTP